MDKTSSQRLLYIDAIRAFAICLIVILHVSSPLVNISYSSSDFYWWPANLVDSFARIGVPLFVLVSGTLLLDPKRIESLGIFFRKRFVKILIPLIGWSVIYLLWRIVYDGESYTLPQAIRSILENKVSSHFWFLYMIIGLYLATPVFRVFTRTASETEYYYYLIIWIVAVGLSPFLAHFLGISLAISWVVVTGFGGYFIGGYFLNQTNHSPRSQWWSIILYLVALVTTIAGTYLLFRQKGKFDSYFYEYLSPNVIIMSLAAYIILHWLPYERIYNRLPWLKRIISLVSTTSFGVYMLHYLLLSILKSGLLGFVLSSASIAPGVGILVTFLAVMPTSIIMVNLIQRIPIIKYLVP